MKLSSVASFVLATAFACSALAADPALGSRKKPLKFSFSPSTDSGKMLASAEPLRKCLEEKTKLYFEMMIPPSYIVVVEGLGSKQVDMAMITSTSYAKALEKKYDVEPLVKVLRKGEPSYFGQIVVRADSGINKLEDLKGKKFAFVDPASGSGYLYPKKLMLQKGIKLGEETFANSKHDLAIMMVYQKQVDGAASFYSAPTDLQKKKCEKIDSKTCIGNDARRLVKTQFPDVFEKVKILTLTEEIPNDPIAIRGAIPAATKSLIKEGLKSCFVSLAAEGKAINDVDGAVDASRAEYEPLIKLFKELKLN